MLNMFRAMAETRATKILLGLLVASFAMWGVQDYLQGNSGGAALTVNGRPVPLSEVDATYRNRVKVIGQMLGAAPTPAQLDELNVPQMVLTELVHRHVLNAATADLGLAPAASVLRSEIANTQAFQVNGAFNLERYKQILANQGLTPRAYETMLGEQLGLAMLADVIALPSPKPEAVAPLLADAATTYTLETLTLTPAMVRGVAQPTPEVLQGFYATNQQAYAVPEKRSFKMLALNPATLASTIAVTDAQMETYFNENLAAYQKPERRSVRHILMAESAEAVALHTQIQTQADFIKLADEHTTDPSGKGKGGDLGEIAATDVVAPFAKVAFELPVGTVGGPVQTPFGWHLIWVDSITPAAAPALVDVKDKVRTDVLAEQTTDALQSLLRTVDDRAAAGNTLAEIATATGLKTSQESLLTAQSNAADTTLVKAAFEAEQGRVEGPFTLADGTMAYLELTAVVAAKVPPLAEIQPRVLADFMQAKTQSVLAEMATSVAAQAQKSLKQPLATVAQGMNLAGGTAGSLTFTGPGDAPPWLHSQLIELYKLPVNGVLATGIPQGDARVVLRMLKRDSQLLTATAQQAATATLKQQWQQNAEALLLAGLVKEANINYNVLQLRQIFGATWSPPQ
ncbi:MAG: SurA N-terminal domain-containing protein [Alphaproteobacteria bacterium]